MWYRKAQQLIKEDNGPGPLFFHTTSLGAVPSILESGNLEGGPYVSLASGKPVYEDIRANAPYAVIAFKRQNLVENLLEVQYDDDWYDQYPDHAAYVAGEGWEAQYEAPEDAYDEDGWEDEEYLQDDYDRAQRDAFWSKSGEQEWIGREAGDLPFDPMQDIAYIGVDDEASANWLREYLKQSPFSSLRIVVK